MKTKLLFSFFLLFINYQIAFAQWTQMGQDIDGEAAGDMSGGTSDISSDGLTLAIGAHFNNGNGVSSGHVRVFTYQTDHWVQIGSDIDGEEAGDSADELSLSGDGFTVAIGAWKNNGNGTKSGHVRVFTYQASEWVQLGDDIDGKSENDQFGTEVSLSYDGLTMAVSGLHNDTGPNAAGYVKIFEYQSGVWQQKGNEIVGEAEYDYMGLVSSGNPLCLSNEGATVAIGAVNNDANGVSSGHVRVFAYQGGNWVQIGADLDGVAAQDRFGYSVSLNEDGSVLGVGALYNDENGVNAGQVRVFQNQSNNWVQIGSSINGENEGDFCGGALSLSSDGAVLAVGALSNDGNGLDSGHVRVFQNQDNHWEQIGADINGEAVEDYSGFSVSLSSNGSIVAIGAYGNDGNGVESGHVRVFHNAYLGVSELSGQDISIYPNPFNKTITFSFSDFLIKKISLTNSLGEIVKTIDDVHSGQRIELSNIASGVYFMTLQVNNQILIKKIIKR